MGKTIFVGTLCVILPLGGLGMLCGLFMGDMALIFLSGIGGMGLTGAGCAIGGLIAWLSGEMEGGTQYISPAKHPRKPAPRRRRSDVRPSIEELGG